MKNVTSGGLTVTACIFICLSINLFKYQCCSAYYGTLKARHLSFLLTAISLVGPVEIPSSAPGLLGKHGGTRPVVDGESRTSSK